MLIRRRPMCPRTFVLSDNVPWLMCPHTVTRAAQNEALLWKIAVLGMKKAPCWCRNILRPSPILLFYIPPCCKFLRSLEQDLLRTVTGKFRKNLRIELLGKSAGDFTAWGGETQDLDIFSKLSKKA
jgi:hypothetical protein